MDEALDYVRRRRHQNKRWPLGSLPPATPPMDLGEVKGGASRWITLRALRVLRAYDRESSEALGNAPPAVERLAAVQQAHNRQGRP